MTFLIKNFLINLEFEIERFKKFIEKLNIKKISISIINNIKIKYSNSYVNLNKISYFKIKDFETIFIYPYNKKDITLIFKSIIKNNYLDLNISILDKSICIKMFAITEEKRKKIINLINNELENTKINIRNIRRNLNFKIKEEFKNKNFSEDEKNKILKDINIHTNEYIKNLNKIFENKKINLLNI